MNQDKISCHFPHLRNVALDGVDGEEEEVGQIFWVDNVIRKDSLIPWGLCITVTGL